MKFRELFEARRTIPKSFKLANGVKVEFVTKKELLGQLSDFNFNFKNNWDVIQNAPRIHDDVELYFKTR